MKKRFYTPAGTFYKLFEDMAKQPHLLVAGTTGSGKSVILNGIITTLLYRYPWEAQFILIDPKRVELSPYKNLPHTIRYASEPQEMVSALYYALQIVEERYKEMEKRRERKYTGGDIYIFIDEFADLVTTQKRAVLPLIQRLGQIARACKVHLVIATQCPLRSIISTEVKVNFDSRVGLRTRSAQDSRNILGYAGLEELPQYGQGIYMTPQGDTLYNIPYVDEAEQERLIVFWEKQNKKKFRLFG